MNTLPCPTFLRLAKVRTELSDDHRYSPESITFMVEALGHSEPAATLAACHIIVDAVSPEHHDLACSHLARVIEKRSISDMHTLSLILEAIQFFPAEELNQPYLQKFLREASIIDAFAELARHLQLRVRGNALSLEDGRSQDQITSQALRPA